MVMLHRRTRPGFLFDLERAMLAKRLPGHIEQIGDADVFEGLERQRAGVQQRRQPQDRRRHVRDDAERAAERRDDAGAGTARKADRQRVEHARAGRHDDDERGDREIRGSQRAPRRTAQLPYQETLRGAALPRRSSAGSLRASSHPPAAPWRLLK